MSVVNLTNVVVHNNPCPFSAEFQFEIDFEVLGGMEDEIEWKLTWISSVDDNGFDQLLDSVVLDPMALGTYKIMFNADPPNMALIPANEVLGVTGILLVAEYSTCSPHLACRDHQLAMPAHTRASLDSQETNRSCRWDIT